MTNQILNLRPRRPSQFQWPQLVLALLFLGFSARAQYEFQFLFRGTCSQTDAAGNLQVTPLTDQILLQDRAQGLGITDLSTIQIVYHVAGDDKGDTVEIVNAFSGGKMAFEFGYWFGSDFSLGRYALTNSSQTEVRRIDYLYTLEDSTYGFSNPDSIGAAYVTKRFLTDNQGNVHTSIEGTMRWIVHPEGNASTKVCVGTFTLGRLLH